MAIRTADAGKAAARIAAIQIALDDFLDDRPEKTILLLEAALILGEEPVKIVKEQPVQDGALWMSRAIDSCHSRSFSSRNRPPHTEPTLGPFPPERGHHKPTLFPSEYQQQLTAIRIRRQLLLSRGPVSLHR
jgi:hypothetical protein